MSYMMYAPTRVLFGAGQLNHLHQQAMPGEKAMLEVVLYRVAGSPSVTGSSPFTDVADGSWCADAMLWASQNGIVSGYGDGLFGVGDPVSHGADRHHPDELYPQ